jgi:hypothetical protein
MTSTIDLGPGREPGLDLGLDAELGLLGLLGSGGSAALVAGVADRELPVPLGFATGLLCDVDPYTLDGDARVDLIRAWERLGAMVAGAQQRALAAVVEATEGCGLAGEDARHEVGAALRLAPGTASERTRVAAVLVGRLPGTLGALEAGAISYGQAAAVAAGVADLPDELAAAVEARVLGRAGHQTVAETRRGVRDAREAVDPGSAAARHEKAKAGRRIERLGQPDAMMSYWFALPASVEAGLWATLTRRAKAARKARRRLGLPDPGVDALRVDALVHAVLHNGGADPDQPTMTFDTRTPVDPTTGADRSAGDAGSAGGPSGPVGAAGGTAGSAGLAGLAGSADGADAADPVGPAGRRLPRCSCGGAQTAAVVIDLATLLGLREAPGQLPGYGAIPAPMAREMAADRSWVRWLVDPGTGALLDVGAETYRPTDRMRRFIAARDRVCGFPGCNRPAAQCDCDHVVTFAHHGKTVRVNLGPLCRQHHNAKTHGLWQLTYHPDTGRKTWTSPLGKTYTVATDPPLT